MPLSDRVALELCIETAGDLVVCDGRVDRIELCCGLQIGGLTPSAGLMQAARKSGVQTHVLIRPRGGDFNYDRADTQTALDDIRFARKLGLNGVVIGALTNGTLDRDALGWMRDAAGDMALTLHRAFDLLENQLDGLETAITLGFDRILTSGGAASAFAGRARIAELQRQAGTRIEVMAGAGINHANAARIVAETGIRSVHASCRGAAIATEQVDALGFGQTGRGADSQEIAKLRAVLDRCTPTL